MINCMQDDEHDPTCLPDEPPPAPPTPPRPLHTGAKLTLQGELTVTRPEGKESSTDE